jgi:hypothetical protein
MKKILLGFAVIALIASCKKENSNSHVANANCGGCHTTEESQWSDVADLHALATADVLTNVDHNTAELLNDDCLKCHSTFQYKMGVAHFVTPVDTIGSPAGTWTALNSGDWQATKCEVCHNPYATNKDRLAKYGSILDGQWNADYTSVSDLPDAYQQILDMSTSTISTYVYPDQTTLSVQATKLCSSCHDPADQGGDPEVVIGGVNFGSQGGDSRSFVVSSHKGFGCIDCHDSHTFQPVNPQITQACIVCHSSGKVTGKVHINHVL